MSIQSVKFRPGKRVGPGRVRSWVKTGPRQNGFGSKRVSYKKGCFGSGRNGFGSERVRVETVPGQNGFRIGSVWLKKMGFFFLKRDCTLRGNFVGLKRVRVCFLNV
ncbi:hypothetical protein HanRHA438_Chr00c20g0852151 [Helianthus annuus]|nr:hypothetical protein HanRHA438_Chr02g0051361 [Helianthus annuus]KAJ0954343.1 hypothetical protein HanRHA438_Chr00c20g0852151 [Helianthus annuus]